jgi:membrane-bound lytic murein transglycosylase A
MKKFALLSCLVLAAIASGCKKPTGPIVAGPPDVDYSRELPPGELALRKITDPAQIPDFTKACSNARFMRQAIANSLNYLAKPSSQSCFPYGEITHAQAVATLNAFDAMLERQLSPARMNQIIRERFDTYISVGWDDRGTVLYTGYYTPIFPASRQPTGQFRYPIYSTPEELRKGPAGEILTPLPPRAQLETSRKDLLAGHELYYLADPFDVYIAQVQGSAILDVDGQRVTVGYAANNGHDYKSVGQELIADGKLDKDQLSLQGLIAYFKAHPREVSEYVNRNPRYVFFAESDDPTPRGCLNEPVTPWHSIATDKSIFPRACLAMIDSALPRRLTSGTAVLDYQGFALDQDTGGAIRAPGRCDVYMGIGDDAGELAGRTYQEGRLYYVFLKPQYVPAPLRAVE